LLPKIAYLSEILSIVFFLCFLKRNKGEGLWVIFLYCVCSVVAEIVAIILDEKHMAYFWPCYTVAEYTIFAYFFYTAFKKKKTRYIPVVGTLIFYLIVIITFYNRTTRAFDSLSASMESILMIIYSIVFLYDQITSPEIMYVFNTKKFWIVAATFLYFSSTLFLFLFAANFTNQEHSTYWIINNFFEILKNTLFCISFAMKKSDANKNSINTYNPDFL
jgi:hypothetical protein